MRCPILINRIEREYESDIIRPNPIRHKISSDLYLLGSIRRKSYELSKYYTKLSQGDY